MRPLQLLLPTELLVVSLHDNEIIPNYGGGLQGIRDEGLLISALERPRNYFLYEDKDLPFLTAVLCYGIIKNHPFMDGNKRTALFTAIIFASENSLIFGYKMKNIPQMEAVETMEKVADNKVSEQELVKWFGKFFTKK